MDQRGGLSHGPVPGVPHGSRNPPTLSLVIKPDLTFFKQVGSKKGKLGDQKIKLRAGLTACEHAVVRIQARAECRAVVKLLSSVYGPGLRILSHLRNKEGKEGRGSVGKKKGRERERERSKCRPGVTLCLQGTEVSSTCNGPQGFPSLSWSWASLELFS